MSRPSLPAFVQQAGALPSLPAICTELSRAIDSPYATITSIGDIIRKDQSLTTRLLRLANSAIYGVPRRIETLDEALNLIGLRQMAELALATTVIDVFSDIPTELANPVTFWEHSVACGIGSAVLAQARGEPIPDRFFVGGLLHDLGRLVMYLQAPKESARILARCRETGELSTVVEEEVLGFDHAALGAALLESWNMRSPLLDMVRYHHHPTRSTAAVADVAVIHVADFLVTAMELGTCGEFAVTPLSREAWRRCALEKDRLEEVVRAIEQRYEPVSALLTQPQPGAMRGSSP